jgi:hypothetical protein
MTYAEKLAKGADALRGLHVTDAEGWGWPLSKAEREEAARRVIEATKS